MKISKTDYEESQKLTAGDAEVSQSHAEEVKGF